jgi:hypothetical protein
MQATMNISLIGEDAVKNHLRSEVPRGPLRLDTMPQWGQLIAIGENDTHLHCIQASTGNYIGISKTIGNPLWDMVLEANIKTEVPDELPEPKIIFLSDLLLYGSGFTVKQMKDYADKKVKAAVLIERNRISEDVRLAIFDLNVSDY